MTAMQKDFKEDPPSFRKEAGPARAENSPTPNQSPGVVARWVNSLIQMGVGESILRLGTNILSILAIAVVVWLVQIFYRQTPRLASGDGAQGPLPTISVDVNTMPALEAPVILGVARSAQLHTNIPSRPRKEISTYTVQAGDTVISIAEKYGLQSKTVFAANYDILQDDPHNLYPDQSLKILPVDGVYWQWLGGIPFGQWAAYFKVKPEVIINYPPNHLEGQFTDYENANVPTGTWLIIPGGDYQYHTPGQMPLGITRSNPASAQVGGSGSCPPIFGGAIGTGIFVFPTARHYLSGFDYTPKTNHLGIDLAGELGDSVFASDGGVIVYAGSNSYGYGNMIMIDHGTGFQSLYAHLSQLFVSCGESVNAGQTIGAVGSTGHSSGPHLHFEVRTSSTVINPWNVLPAP